MTWWLEMLSHRLINDILQASPRSLGCGLLLEDMYSLHGVECSCLWQHVFLPLFNGVLPLVNSALSITCSPIVATTVSCMSMVEEVLVNLWVRSPGLSLRLLACVPLRVL
jgi:hypothetical protein